MLRSLQRPIALILLPCTLQLAGGCTSVRSIPRVEAEPPTVDHLKGVTTLDGLVLRFDQDAVVRADTVEGTVHRQIRRVPVDSVQRWWLQRSDAGKTVFATLGVLAGVALALGVVAAATKESCPFIYSWDGERYTFDAEPYGGAVTRGLERDDYGALPHLRSDSGVYRLLVTNEVNETQMTNLFELWTVDHAPGLRVVPDEWGGLHTVAAPVAPASAVDQRGADLRPWLADDDHRIWEPLPVSDGTGSLRDSIVLTFPRPAGAMRAKLVTRVGTALWGSHMIRALLGLRGASVDAWYAHVDSVPAAADSVRAWAAREELYGLQLQVLERSGWRVRGLVPGSGPFLAAERVVPLDLRGVEGDSVRIRIRPPRGFWALGYFAMDFSPDQPVAVDTIAPRSASAPDVLAAVREADTLYYAMPHTGDRATLEFPVPPLRPALERSVMLHSRGWYRLHLDPVGAADTALARRLMEVPGTAVEYSASRYREWPMARLGSRR